MTLNKYKIRFMETTVLYRSVLEKLVQLSPKELATLDEFLSKLLGHTNKKKTGNKKSGIESPVDWLERLASANSLQSIDDHSEWQRQIRQDRPLTR